MLDKNDLAGAAKRDVKAMIAKIDNYDADGKCKKLYKKAAAPILEMTNSNFDAALKKILKEAK